MTHHSFHPTGDAPDIPDHRGSRVHIVALRDVRATSVRWLWPGYFPLGKLVVLDGYPGQGKSTLLLDIAARLSVGHPMPTGHSASAPGLATSEDTNLRHTSIADPIVADTIMLTYEDDAADTLRPRLEAAGGDVARVHHVAGVTRSGDDALVPASLPSDLDDLDAALGGYPNVRLLVIDPLSAALSAEVDSYKEQDVRRVLARLARIAAAREICVVAVRHLRKNAGRNAIVAGSGSIGIIGQARVGLLVERHPDDADASVLAVAKTNVGRKAPSLVFKKVTTHVAGDAGEQIETSRVEWTGAVALSADDLLAPRGDDDADDKSDATAWLRDVLTSGARVIRASIFEAASAAGFKWRTIERVAERLGVKKTREGFGTALRSYWELPASIPATSPIPAIPATDADVAGMAGMAGMDASDAAEVADIDEVSPLTDRLSDLEAA